MILEVKDLSKKFTQGGRTIDVIDRLNLNMNAGETLAILGPSGSGKTTLLSLLAGLDSPTSGDITIAGQSITKLNEKELTSFRGENLGIIFQQFYLFSHLTALENVALPLEIINDKNAYKKAREALKLVGLSDREDHFPKEMSGGENQRVAFARAFVVEPKILLADEPSGSLDTKTGHQVMDLLFDLVKRKNTTLVLVTHNEELASRCQKQLRFT
ncbi:MAG: ABC transporter ATP-binding protein [Bdellovibrionales bacterium]|nr:ABC transporter ATP-binding protein [Bdellovibrionales bacterium]